MAYDLFGGIGGLLAEVSPGWGKWWLPPNHSQHGGEIDMLFNWIFWITMVTFVIVELVLVIFLIKYRHRPERRATFTHGNTRLEMCWTVAPAIILAVLALFSKGVWERYHASAGDGENPATILVIGQQFKWNVVYPGPDGKLGRYLIFPRPTDTRWPDGKTHGGVKGPAFLPYSRAISEINTYVARDNPLGKDLDDPAGKDDDWSKTPGRPIVIPANRPIEVQLSSLDVIHDFFLPNFRVKLDAVPGMRGLIHFTSKTQGTETYDLDALPPDLIVYLDNSIEAAKFVGGKNASATGSPGEYEIQHPTRKIQIGNRKGPEPIIRNLQSLNEAATKRLQRSTRKQPNELTADEIAAEVSAVRGELREQGVTRLAAIARPFEVVCEELCGGQHFSMRADLFIVSNDEYEKFIHRNATTTDATAEAEDADEPVAAAN